ncbi:MAG TPA: 2'-5' RNA ligase family protein [Lacipirellulaceae bacterium]|nr:2'-5' RNA ligase family protein [Lacipirellulaceae bacterium]
MDSLRRLCPVAVLIAAFALPAGSALGGSDADRVIAIDVLLLPDATMVEQAKAANAELRSNYAAGYALDGDQTAHITLVHRYVHEKDLPAIEAAVAKVSEQADPLDWELTANGYRYGIWAKLAITNIAIDRTPNLDRYQEAIAEAVEPFAVKKGTADAFSTSRELPKIEHEIIDYVEKFVPKSTGQNYSPHVTIGVAHEDFVLGLKEKPFDSFRFKAAGVAIYQLGNFGTAQKKLWVWDTKSEEK